LILNIIHRNGYPCPTNYNPADFYVQTLAIRSGKEDECRERCHQIFSAHEAEQAADIKAGKNYLMK